jgi:hypothetical protein
MGRGLACSVGCSFSILWCGEAFHELEVQNVDVSALPGALPQLSLVLYLSQVCLQPLSKVPGSRSSRDLQLCPSRHLGSLLKLCTLCAKGLFSLNCILGSIAAAVFSLIGFTGVGWLVFSLLPLST